MLTLSLFSSTLALGMLHRLDVEVDRLTKYSQLVVFLYLALSMSVFYLICNPSLIS